jgi:predicted porin
MFIFIKEKQMKKILVLAALVAATFAASAQVTIYGRVAEYIDHTTVGGVTTNKMVDDATRIGFTVTESLGNGLTANFKLETAVAGNDPTVAAATQLGSRQSTVGLSNASGSVDFGRKNHSYYQTIVNYDVFGMDYGTITTDINNVRGRRTSNGAFASYTFGPVTVSADRSFSGAADEGSSISATGTLGPVQTTLAHYELGQSKSTMLAGKGAVLGATMSVSYSLDTDLGVDTRGSLIAASYPLAGTPVKLKAAYGVKTGDNIERVTAYSLGAAYALSKRTSVNVAYRNVNDTIDIQQLGIGLSHSF